MKKDFVLKSPKGGRTNDPTMRLKDLSTITGESVSKIAAMQHNSATAPKPRLTIRPAAGGGVPANYYSCAELIAWYNSLPGRHVDAVAQHGYIRVSRESLSKRMTPKVLDFLKVARGVKDLAPDVGMHPNTLYKLLQALRYEKKAHICGYRDFTSGRPVALWIAGEGKDAPVPKKLSRAEVSKRYRLRDENSEGGVEPAAFALATATAQANHKLQLVREALHSDVLIGQYSLARLLRMSPMMVTVYLQTLHSMGLAHVAQWGYDGSNSNVELWRAGPGVDAPLVLETKPAGKVIAKLSPMRSLIVPKAKVEVRRDPLTAAFFEGGV